MNWIYSGEARAGDCQRNRSWDGCRGGPQSPNRGPAKVRRPPNRQAIVFRFLSGRKRMLGGEARGFPSDTPENTRFVSLRSEPQQNKGLTACSTPPEPKRGLDPISLWAPDPFRFANLGFAHQASSRTSPWTSSTCRSSIRLDQAVFFTQSRSALTSAFAVSISFLMTATIATFAGFPAARSAEYFALRSGLKRMATRAGM